MFEHTLVCLDGSGLSEQVLPYVIEEASSFKQVTLLRVLAGPDATMPFGVPGSPGVPIRTETMLKAFEKELDAAPEYLERLAQPIRSQGVFVQCAVLQGAPGETIVDYARENGVTLIAIATHGHGGLRKALFGSTAEFLMRNASMPLLVVRPK